MITQSLCKSLFSAYVVSLTILGAGCGSADSDSTSQSYNLADDRDDSRGDTAESGAWPMFNHDSSGSRWNRAEYELNPATVPGLHILWNFPTAASVSATPVVASDTIYAGDGSLGSSAKGNFYALTRSGRLRWKTQVAGGITGSALVSGEVVIFGDQTGTIYGLNRRDGTVRWQTRPNTHAAAAIYGSPTPVGDLVAIGVASNEELATADPNYPCCSFRGSVVMLNPRDGSIRWQTYMISNADAAKGSSGAAVWSTPTFDEESNTIYVTTGNNYSSPATLTSDAFVALDARTGQFRWVSQRTALDVSNLRYPFSNEHPDADFGDSPQVYRLNGRKVVGAGQKTGIYYVLDARSGQLLNAGIQVVPDGQVGGLFSDTAVAGGVIFANGINWPNFPSPPLSGDLIAISGDGTRVLWDFQTPNSPNAAGVAVAGGVVYFQSLVDGGLYALNARSGALLSRVTVGAGSSGPAVSCGRVYVGTGSFLAPATAPGSIVALGL